MIPVYRDVFDVVELVLRSILALFRVSEPFSMHLQMNCRKTHDFQEQGKFSRNEWPFLRGRRGKSHSRSDGQYRRQESRMELTGEFRKTNIAALLSTTSMPLTNSNSLPHTTINLNLILLLNMIYLITPWRWPPHHIRIALCINPPYIGTSINRPPIEPHAR